MKNIIVINIFLFIVISINLFWLWSTFGDAARFMQIPQIELLKLSQIELIGLKMPIYESAIASFLIFMSVWLFYDINFKKKDE